MKSHQIAGIIMIIFAFFLIYEKVRHNAYCTDPSHGHKPKVESKGWPQVESKVESKD